MTIPSQLLDSAQNPDAYSFWNELRVKYVPQILSDMPKEWRGTTFANDGRLLGRDEFSRNISRLLLRKEVTGQSITKRDLRNVGYADDYFRVGSNVSTLLEMAVSTQKQIPLGQVFTFGSSTMPVVAVLLTAKAPVRVYYPLGEKEPFTESELSIIELLGVEVSFHQGSPQADPNSVVLEIKSVDDESKYVLTKNCVSTVADAVVTPNVLSIFDSTKISPDEVHTIRKRMATPMTTPMAMAALREHCSTANMDSEQERAHLDSCWEERRTMNAMPAESELREFYAHLQELSGTQVNTSADPVVFTAGLPALASLFVALLQKGGSDVLMCSTAYGGSSQLNDLLTSRSNIHRKFTFDVQGDTDICESIQQQLTALASQPESAMPTTVLFLETPTNPDMKVPEFQRVAAMLRDHRDKTGKDVLLLLDTTFAPQAKLMHHLEKEAPDLPVMTFISMSKSISRGKTTAGAVIANHTEQSKSLLSRVVEVAALLDTTAKPDQLQFLTQNHRGVEERNEKAYAVAAAMGDTLCSAVQENCEYDMPLAFVTPEHAAQGFTSATFSFNLPPQRGASQAETDKLAQRFVELLCMHPQFKPCVSFGQDNEMVYATVPATSTQGAIKAEDKAKQEVGGVQLARLSFPPVCDVSAISSILADSVSTLYNNEKLL